MTITLDNLCRRVAGREPLASGMGGWLIRVRVSTSNVRCAPSPTTRGVGGRRLWLSRPQLGSHRKAREPRVAETRNSPG
jgi:hypothetical protein